MAVTREISNKIQIKEENVLFAKKKRGKCLLQIKAMPLCGSTLCPAVRTIFLWIGSKLRPFHAKSISTPCRFAGRMKDADGSIYMRAYVFQLAPPKYI
jgi:hypothetical protein